MIIWETSAIFFKTWSENTSAHLIFRWCFQGSRDASSTVEWRYKGGPNLSVFVAMVRDIWCMICLRYTEQKMFCMTFVRSSVRKNMINDDTFLILYACIWYIYTHVHVSRFNWTTLQSFVTRLSSGFFIVAISVLQVLPLSPQHHDCLILGSASLLRGGESK